MWLGIKFGSKPAGMKNVNEFLGFIKGVEIYFLDERLSEFFNVNLIHYIKWKYHELNIVVIYKTLP